MEQPELFVSRKESLEEKLERAAREGRLFYSVSQAAKLLGVTEFMARYRIEMFRLDALLVCCEYRIPYTAILDCIKSEGLVLRQWLSMLALQRKLEAGRQAGHHEFMDYSSMDGTESNLRDWYDLQMLPLPAEATARSWASMMSTRSDLLCKETGWKACQMITWPEFYDYLIEHEVINLPCPFNTKESIMTTDLDETEIQPGLF